MAEYERQFDAPSHSSSLFEQSSFDFDSRRFDGTPATLGTDIVVASPQLQYRPHSALAPAPVVPAPAPEFAGTSAAAPRSLGPIALGPIALGPATPSSTPVLDAPESEFNRVYNDASALTLAPQTRAAAEPLTEDAPVGATVTAGTGSNRSAVLVGARIMAAAIVLILLGVAAMVFFSLQSSVGAGEAQTNAIVTSLGVTSANSCTPVARFAVAGKSYTASSSAAISPCPIGLGESVSVVYSAANPASEARIEVGSPITQYVWLIPILGVLIFAGGLIAFILRAGTLAAGIALLRDGRTRTVEPAAV